jgi:hypothetical protein
MRHNRLRALLKVDEPSLGTHLLSSWSTPVELVGDAGNYGCARIRASKCSLRSNGRARSIRRLATCSLRSQCDGGIEAYGCWRKFVDVDVSGDGGGYAIRRSLDRTGQPIVGT